MASDTFDVSPSKIPGVSNGDIEINSDFLTTANAPEATTIRLGQVTAGKFIPDYHSYFRFDVDIPQGSTIDAIQFRAKVVAGQAGLQISLSGGWCKPQATAPKWQDSAAVYGWTITGDAALAEWSNGLGSDVTVFHGDAHGFEAVTGFIPPPASLLTVGSGTGSNVINAPGLLTQLESYLAANEIMRDGSGKIPILFYGYRKWTGGADNYLTVLSRDYSIASDRPKLFVEWTEPAPPDTVKSASGRPGLGQTVTGRPELGGAVTGRSRTSATVSGKPGLGGAVEGRPGLGPAVSGRPGLS